MSTLRITATHGDRSITIEDESGHPSRFDQITKWLLIGLGGEGQ